MAIREDLVASAVQFLQDPSVASSSVENRISFLQSKNLTQEEIDAALGRAGGHAAPSQAPYPGGPSGPPQPYYQPYSQYAWQPPPLAPRRDWRDWFIVATVASGLGYGLYSLGKRYVYPLVAPPTPERLEQDKKSIEEQFDKAFALVEQLSKDTEALKNAEQQRTEKLDTVLSELETVMTDLKSANRRREDDSQRIREEVQSLKDAIPKAMNNQKDLTDTRLFEINSELTSLKTLVSQRMTSASSPSPSTSHLRPSTGTSSQATTTSAPTIGRPVTVTSENPTESSSSAAAAAPKSLSQSSFNRSSAVPNGTSGTKASIPAWQMAMASQSAGESSPSASAGDDNTASAKAEASSSS